MTDARALAARRAFARAAAFSWGAPVVLLAATLVASASVFSVSRNAMNPAPDLLAMLCSAAAVSACLRLLSRGRPPLAPRGVPLTRSAEASLWTVIDAAARGVGMSPPAALILTAGADVRVVHDHDGRRLALGLPWLCADVRDLEVAVGRALVRARLGEGSPRDRALDGRVGRAQELGQSPTVALLLRPYARLLTRLRDGVDIKRSAAADASAEGAWGVARQRRVAHAQTTANAFPGFWQSRVAPCVEDGFAPAVLDGWEDAKGSLDGAPVPLSARATLSRRLLRALYPGAEPALVDLPWPRAGEAVWLPRLRAALAEEGLTMPPFMLADLAKTVREAAAADEEAPSLIGAMVTVALVEAGWTLHLPPSGPLEVASHEHALIPTFLCHGLATGQASDDDWARLADELEIGEVLVDQAALAVRAGPPAACGPDTVVPSRTPQRFALRPSPNRIPGLVGLGLVAALAMSIGLTFLVVGTTATGTAGGRIAVLAFGLTMVGGAALLLALRLPPLLRRGVLTVTGEEALIEHRGLLAEPFVIPRGALSAVLIDEGEWAPDRRFPAGDVGPLSDGANASWYEPLWLWRKRQSGGLVPVFGSGGDIPNVALLVERPELLANVRVRHPHGTGPLPGELLNGLLLSVKDSNAVAAAFAPWDVVRPAYHGDAFRVATRFLGTAPQTRTRPDPAPAVRDAVPAPFALMPPAPRRARVVLLHDRAIRGAWVSVLGGLLIPPLALGGAVTGVRHRRAHGGQLPLILSGAAVFALRMGFYLHGG